jgi:hypothetical protein
MACYRSPSQRGLYYAVHPPREERAVGVLSLVSRPASERKHNPRLRASAAGSLYSPWTDSSPRPYPREHSRTRRSLRPFALRAFVRRADARRGRRGRMTRATSVWNRAGGFAQMESVQCRPFGEVGLGVGRSEGLSESGALPLPRVTYPSWRTLYVLPIGITIPLHHGALLLHDSEVPRYYPYQGTEQEDPGGAGNPYTCKR